MTMYYIQSNVFCLFILLIIELAFRNKKGSFTAKGLAFTRLLLIVGMVCISDLGAWTVQGRIFPGCRFLNYLSNILYDASITACGYMWLYYVDLHIKGLGYYYKRRRYIMAIPFAVMLLLLVTDPLTGWLFTVSDQNVYTRTGGIVIHWIISWGYLVLATVEALVAYLKTDARADRSQLFRLTVFIIPCAISAAMQMCFYGVTSTQCGMTIAVLFVASQSFADEISRDTLTGLNNRRAFKNYIMDRLRRGVAHMTVFMCDVDHFKSVNDTYGHPIGDLVLQQIADVMKKACGRADCPLFLCRYGGDEFIICGFDLTEEDITALKADIAKELAEIRSDAFVKGPLDVSIGHVQGSCVTYNDVEELIRLADGLMYRNKREKSIGER